MTTEGNYGGESEARKYLTVKGGSGRRNSRKLGHVYQADRREKGRERQEESRSSITKGLEGLVYLPDPHPESG